MPYQLYYLDYIDNATGKTLVATPGSAYTVKVASGRNAAMPSYPGDGRWANATTFLNLAIEKPEPPMPFIKPGADTSASPSSDKDKGGA